MQGVIRLENVKFGYQKYENIFTNLSLEIEEGQTIGLVGSNGAGKSTLLKLLVGLETHNEGQIIISGIESSHKSLNRIRKKRLAMPFKMQTLNSL